ncbi:MAG: hypothetical protein KGY45_03840, partial [Hadesarchaea archaeon]|nr:hypothetical protein [Hadesarchaea archaeon]
MNVNFKRWVVVGFLAVMILFSFFHLSSAGTDYKILTTSDSGFFYGIARETNEMNGLPDTYELSHPPQGRPVKGNVQFQPLMLTMFYRGLNFLDSGISLMTACQYFSPFIFTLALIGAFLAGRELGGNISGGASVLFMSTLIGSIYWTKIGAFDREISLMLFGAWMFYFLVKIFKARKDEIWKYSILSGLVYGLFLLTWQGALFIAAIPVGALILILLIRFPSSYTSSENIEEAIITDFNKTKHLIAGIIAMFVISTGIAITIGGYSPDFWAGFVQKILGFFGVGGTGGLGSPLVATEQQVPQNYLASLSGQLYRSIILTRLTIIFVAFAVLKVMWTRKKKELLLIFALIVPAAM